MAPERSAAWLEEVQAELSRRRSVSFDAHEAGIERGEGRTWILNSRGRDVTFGFSLGSVHVRVAAGFSTMRYEVPLESDAPDPSRLVARVEHEAEAFAGVDPVSDSRVPVVLSPRAAAVWLRWITPFFFRTDENGSTGARGLPRRRGFHIVDDPSVLYDGEGRRARRRTYLHDGQLTDSISDSRDPSALEQDIGPMRRDSFRDTPFPGPLSLAIPPDGSVGSPVDDLVKGLYVTALTPRNAPGSDAFLAEVRGQWIEKGRPRHPVGVTLMTLETHGGLGRVIGRGAAARTGPPGVPTLTPCLLFDRAALVPL